MKHRTKILVAIGAVVVAIAVLVPLLINANTYRPMLESQLSQSLGRQVHLGDMSFSLFSGSLVAKDVSISDDPAFSNQPFLQAKSLKIGVEVGPLIFHRQLKVTHFASEQPDIHLIHSAKGPWNFSSIGKQGVSAANTPQHQAMFPDLAVGEVAIDEGRATVSDLPATGQPLVYDHVNLTATQFSFVKRFPFTLSAALPGGGSLKIEGQAGPVSERDAADTPLDANIKLTHFDPVAAGAVQKDQGFAMLGDLTAHVHSDGQTLATTGTLHADKLQLVRNGAPAPKPVDVDFDLAQNLQTHAGIVRRIAIKTGTVAALVGGTFQQNAQQTDLNLRLTGQNLSIDQLESLLPALGVRLPSGSALRGGVLTTDLIIRGPANAPVVTGPVAVSNTRLAGFNLGSKLGGIAALTGAKTGDTTELQALRLALQSSPAGVRTDNVYAFLPALGTVTGDGTVSSAGALNYRLLVKLNTSSGVAGVATGLLSQFGGAAGNFTTKTAANGIGVSITGTTTNPVFTPDVKGIGGSLLQNQPGGQKSNPLQNPAGALTQLLGKH
jgi:AsmA protein